MANKILGKIKPHLLILGLAVLFTTIFTWPFAINLTSYYTDQGDYPTHGSILWWNQDSLKTGRIFSPEDYWHGYMFYPHSYSLAFANNHVFPSLIFSPIYWITNNLPFSVNFYVFLTFILTFSTCFYFINYFVQNKWAAMVGAFIFTFNPQTITRFPQHIELLGKYFLPLIFLFAYKVLTKPNFKDAFWLFLCITLNSLTANYFQIFTYVMLPLAALPFLIRNAWSKQWAYFLHLGKVSLVGLIFLPILLYFNLPFWQFSQKEGVVRTVDETIFFSARINDWFGATTNNLVYGGWTKYLEQFREPKDDRGILNYEEHTLFISLIAIALFLYGLKYFWKQKLNRGYFLLLLGATFVLTFGPYLGYDQESFKLPFYYLHQLVPLMKGIRAPSRFEYIFLIPFVLIVAFGVKRLLGRKNINVITIITIITVILTLENFTFKNYNDRSQILPKINQIGHEELSFLQDKVTIHLPVFTIADADVFGKNSIYSNWLTQTHEKMINGNSGYFPPDIMTFLYQTNDNVDQIALQKLAVLGVDYIIIHKDLMTPPKILSQGKIFDQQNIEIIDLAKISLTPKICNFPGSFEISEISIKNVSDCFLPSIYEDRYRMINQRLFRMPIIIGPGEEVILDE